MKFLKIMSLVSVVSLSGTLAYGQQEKREEKQAEKQQVQPKQQAQPKQREQRAQQPAQPQERQKPDAARPATAVRPQQRQQQETARPATAAKPQEQLKPDAARPAAGTRPQQVRPQEHVAQRQQPAPFADQGGQQKHYAPPQRTKQQAQAWQQQAGWRAQGAWQGHSSWQQDRSSNWQSDHRTWAQRGGYGGYYIPEDSFSLHFGEGHWFRIQSQPVIVDGYPRFQYGGYTFMLVDPWPSDWAQDWYASDDVYVGYDNGYYLYNRMHPGEAVAITVVL